MQQFSWDLRRLLSSSRQQFGVNVRESNRGRRLSRESLEIKLRAGQHINRNSGCPEIDGEWMRVANWFGHRRVVRERDRPGQKEMKRRMERERVLECNVVSGQISRKAVV